MTTTHLIEEYKVKENTILCVCGWKDDASQFKFHQEVSWPTNKKPSPNPYEMDAFNGPISIVDKGITREIRFNHPDLFDYVDDTQKEDYEIFPRALPEDGDF